MADQQTPTAETPVETDAPVPVEIEPVAQPAVDLPPGAWIHGTGRRKASVARVCIRPGEGKYTVNGRDIETFFNQQRDRNDMLAPLEATDTKGQVDVKVTVRGGGPSGQAGAARLGLSRALKKYDPTLEHALRDTGFLTTDARKVERKKYGQPGARRRFQFSKR